MSDPIPTRDNRIAVIIGRLFHPFLLPVPTLLIILNGLPLGELVAWLAVVIAIILIPGMISTVIMDRYISPVYKRRSRDLLYVVGWISVLACLIVVLYFHAPDVLVACIATLVIWVPLQWAVNHWITKISAHAAVATGCFVALVVLGKAGSLPVTLALLACVITTLWARVVTRNHTPLQVLLGVLVGALPVIIVFPLVLA